MITYFENFLNYIFFIFLIHIKFHTNRMLFIIQYITYFLCIILYYKNLKFKHLINDIIFIFDLLEILQG